jgi:hypothetical protein
VSLSEKTKALQTKLVAEALATAPNG